MKVIMFTFWSLIGLVVESYYLICFITFISDEERPNIGTIFLIKKSVSLLFLSCIWFGYLPPQQWSNFFWFFSFSLPFSNTHTHTHTPLCSSSGSDCIHHYSMPWLTLHVLVLTASPLSMIERQALERHALIKKTPRTANTWSLCQLSYTQDSIRKNTPNMQKHWWVEVWGFFSFFIDVPMHVSGNSMI